MKSQQLQCAVALRPFMICGEVALPGDFVEVTASEHASLMYRGFIRDLNDDDRDSTDEPEQDKE